jgi:hypothetical protein|tara:strand:- start:328 stop:942 length:615 start_codon:yes stop_codon:yes gene_type:complete
MSLATYASDFNNIENVENPIQKKRVTMRNKTLKRPSNHSNGSTKSNTNVDALMQKIHNSGGDYGDNNDGDEDDESSGKFQPMVQYPDSVGIERMDNDHSTNNEEYGSLANDSEKEGFTQLPSEYAKQYYQQYVPYYNQSSDDLSPNGANKDELLNKLNQVIYLLEEQQDEKTGRVTEELILYSFLGIFIIFIVDSFARVGKYVR